MVIDTNNINSSGSARSRSITVPTNAAKPQTAPVEAAIASSKDNVVISPEAQNMTRLQAKISAMPDVNLDRVAAIKQAIAEGRFEINAERIAENMLNQDELLN